MANFSSHPQISSSYTLYLSRILDLHAKQVRKDRTPYIAHLLTVAGEGLRLGSFIRKGEITSLAGAAHDTLEDIPGMTEGYLKDLLGKNGPEIVSIVKEVTERKELEGTQAKIDYANRILTMSLPALIISMSDKYDNIEGYCNLALLNHDFNKRSVLGFYRRLIINYKARIQTVTNPTLKDHLTFKLKAINNKTSMLKTIN